MNASDEYAISNGAASSRASVDGWHLMVTEVPGCQRFVDKVMLIGILVLPGCVQTGWRTTK